MFAYWKLHRIPILLFLGSLVFYGVFAFDLQREDFPKLISLYGALFFLYIKLVRLQAWNFKFLLVAGVLIRLVFLWTEPNLSQDFYRFLWDGELIAQGMNPYSFTPDELLVDPNFSLPNANELHQGMGALSARHYSNYPPMNQLLFALSAFLGMGSTLAGVVWMRICIILADLGIVLFGKKLLAHLEMDEGMVFWYFLNPLVVIELTGNLHFEGVMLFFFVWAMYLVAKGKLWFAGPVYAASIFLKLVPILFLPLFLPYLGFKKSMALYTMVGIGGSVMVLPFYSPSLAEHYGQTIGLWFSNFEFNAGIYNLVKKIALIRYEVKPWVLIKEYGFLLKLYIPLVVALLTFFKPHRDLKAIFGSMFLILGLYYALSSTVHPWYLVFLLFLGLFTKYRVVMVWTATVMLSYYAYSQTDFKENLWLLGLEYLAVFGYLSYEIHKNHNNLGLIRKK